MKGQTKLKIYSSVYRYLVTKLRSLGHKVVERFTSQRFPMTGTQMQFSGSNQVTSKMITIRFVYYITLTWTSISMAGQNINGWTEYQWLDRISMAGQNSSILGVCDMTDLPRPESK
jgi:hypothetical protein